MFYGKASTITNVNLLVTMKVYSKGDVVVILSDMIWCSWVKIAAFFSFSFNTCKHCFQRGIFKGQFFSNLSKIGAVLSLIEIFFSLIKTLFVDFELNLRFLVVLEITEIE